MCVADGVIQTTNQSHNSSPPTLSPVVDDLQLICSATAIATGGQHLLPTPQDCPYSLRHQSPPARCHHGSEGPQNMCDDGLLEREVVLGYDDDARSLFVAENPARTAEGEAGATVWDCGLVLAHYLIKQHALGNLRLVQQRVIELGAGTGVVGLTAAGLGAQQVVLTDRPALQAHLQRNIQRNQLQVSAQSAALEWGEQPLPASIQRCPYDLVLCSDVVYSPGSVRPLLATLQQLASGPDSLVLLAAEFRQGAGIELLHQLLPEYGFQAQLVPYTDMHEEFCSPDILAWRITRGPAPAPEATPHAGRQPQRAPQGPS